MEFQTRVFYDDDADPDGLAGETVAVLGFGIQGSAQARTLRDSGVAIIVGNRDDGYRRRAEKEGFEVGGIEWAVRQATVVIVLVPDEIQPAVFRDSIQSHLRAGDALVFAHGFALTYDLVQPPDDVDVLLLAPRLPGQYVRSRFLEGWGVPAFVSVEQDATGKAHGRLLGLARALGITRCGAVETTASVETELDHFSEHFLYPLILRALEIAFEELVEAGYDPCVALMELHGSGELAEVLRAAGQEGLYRMLDSHASPACQVGIAHHWRDALGPENAARQRIGQVLASIGEGAFARHLIEQQRHGYPELQQWRKGRSEALSAAERRLRKLLLTPPAD